MCAFLVIDFTAREPQSLGVSADLRYLYPSSAPGREHLRPCEVIVYPSLFAHLRQHDAGRTVMLQGMSYLMAKAIQEPELVHSELERSGEGHWVQAYAVENPGRRGMYVVVVVSLANIPGTARSDHHKVITAFPAKEREFFRRATDGRLQLKSRWVRVER